MDAIAPTPERLAKTDDIKAPRHDQRHLAIAYRSVSRFESLHKRGTIDDAQYQAGEKLSRHLEGMHGADVRMDDAASNPPDLLREEAPLYHGQKVAEARTTLLPQEWTALLALIEGKITSMEEIGRAWQGVRDRKAATGYGSGLVQTALDRLAFMWGFKQSPFVAHSPQYPP